MFVAKLSLHTLLPLLAQAAAKGDDAGGFLGSMFLPLALIMVLFFFMILRPEQKKKKEMELLLSGLKKNDHVVTVGGICGTVVNVSPNSIYLTIRVDDSNNTRLKVLRSAISRVGQPDEGEKETSDSA